MPRGQLRPTRIGYARVSSRDQNLEMQLNALAKAACYRIFTDKLSGAEVERPGLREALSHLREADTLVVWKLDRLGRSVKGLVDLVNELEARKVHFQSISDGVDTTNGPGEWVRCLDRDGSRQILSVLTAVCIRSSNNQL